MSRGLAISEGVEEMLVDGDILLWDGRAVYRLTGSAATIWLALTHLHDEDAIITSLRARVPDSGAQRLAEDVRDFLTELNRDGLIHDVDREEGQRMLRVPAYVAWVEDPTSSLVTVADLRQDGHRRTLSEPAGLLWCAVAEGHSCEVAGRQAVQQLGGDLDELAPQIASVWETLVDEQLLVDP